MSDWLDAEQHVERAHEYYERGRWDDAEHELRYAISVNPYQPEWHFNLGLTLEAAGRYDAAAAAFTDAAGLQSDDQAPLVSAAANWIRAGEPEKAIVLIDRAASEGCDIPSLHVHRIEALADLERYEDAEVAYYVAIQSHGDDADIHGAMGDALADAGDAERALLCLREAARLDPDVPQINARLGRVYEDTGRFERARQLYMRQLRTDPGDIDTLLDLGSLLMEMNRDDEAAEKLRRVLEIDPRCADAHEGLADLAERAGRIDRAIIELDVALRLEPDLRGARRRLARLLLARRGEGDAKRAVAILDVERSLVAETGGDEAQAVLAELVELLLDAGRAADAVPVAEQLRRCVPDDVDAIHLHALALLEANRITEGMHAAREVVRRRPRFIPAMHNLALAHIRSGEWLRARYWLTQATQIDSHDDAVRRLRIRLKIHTVSSLLLGMPRAAFRLAASIARLVGRPTRTVRRA